MSPNLRDVTHSFDDGVLHAAEIIAGTFDDFLARQRELVRVARTHFERADWHAVQANSHRRLDLYNEKVHEGLGRLHGLLGPRISDLDTWAELRDCFAGRVAERADAEVAETFFNSFTRRLFHTVG